MRTRIAVLASGSGSNLGALLAHLDALGEGRHADIAAVIADRPAARALHRARERGIPTYVLDDPADGLALGQRLDEAGAQLVVLAGYLRLVPAPIVARFRGRILNVHPALLPAFGGPGMYGIRIHRAVLDAGVRVSGVTVHFVDEQYDRGPIAAQWPVPVLEDDTPERLAARVLRVEHALFPRVIEGVAAGTIALGAEGRVRGAATLDDGASFVLAGRADQTLGSNIAHALRSASHR
ncbi:MAG TPA: phosphoribosylglycinamide formyltransferase [Gemmatimonadaceae bacterium]|nr:phosphoribosylglycinamide formyltransferase [Gemmatimonadaceae bacterium]